MNYKKQIIDDQFLDQVEQSRKQTLRSNQSKQKSGSILTENLSVSQLQPFKKIMCEQHNQEITMICCVSQWHCELLCVECIPQHTLQHNKNKTQSQIKKYDDVLIDCRNKCQNYLDLLNNVKTKIENTIQSPYQDQNINNIKLWKSQIIQIIENYFNSVIDEYEKKLILIKKTETEQLTKLLEKIEQYQQEYQQRIDDITLFNLNPDKEISLIYDDIESIKQIPQEEYKLNLNLQKYLVDNIGRMLLLEQVTQQQVIQQNKKIQKIPQKNTKCEKCGNQMTYVSDFKKHMECTQCLKIQRPNNVKK